MFKVENQSNPKFCDFQVIENLTSIHIGDPVNRFGIDINLIDLHVPG